MLLTTLLTSAEQTVEAVADTTIHKIKFTEKLAELSNMSMHQVVEHITSGLISIAIKICIAVAIYFIGRWLIRYVRRVIGRIMERRNVDLSLRAFIQNSTHPIPNYGDYRSLGD